MGRILQIICSCVLALALTGASPQGDPAAVKNQANQEARPTQPPPAAEQGDSSDQLYAACGSGEDNRESDLCAQWKAADSAKVAAVWTRQTGIFTGWGLVIGFVTMVAAIAAAVFAALASGHTKRSATIAENSYVADTRAWLTIRSVSFAPFEVATNEAGIACIASPLTIGVENYGNGVAYNCVVLMGWKRGDGDWVAPEKGERASQWFDTLVPSGEEKVQMFTSEVLDEIWGIGLLTLWISVRYETPGVKGVRETTQRLSVGEHVDPPDMRCMDRALFTLGSRWSLKTRAFHTTMT